MVRVSEWNLVWHDQTIGIGVAIVKNHALLTQGWATPGSGKRHDQIWSDGRSIKRTRKNFGKTPEAFFRAVDYQRFRGD